MIKSRSYLGLLGPMSLRPNISPKPEIAKSVSISPDPSVTKAGLAGKKPTQKNPKNPPKSGFFLGFFDFLVSTGKISV